MELSGFMPHLCTPASSSAKRPRLTLAILQVPWQKMGQSWSIHSCGSTISSAKMTLAKSVRDVVCAISKPCAASGWAVDHSWFCFNLETITSSSPRMGTFGRKEGVSPWRCLCLHLALEILYVPLSLGAKLGRRGPEHFYVC